ncbi:MAG: PilZ domain-containing protein [Nitrospirota bacterium]
MSGQKSGRNRNNRQHKRFEERCKTEFCVKNARYRGLSSNFSLGGLFIRTRHPFPPGTPVTIVIHLPDGASSHIRGKVSRASIAPAGKGSQTRKYLQKGFGIEITEKDTHYLHFLRYLLNLETLGKKYARSEISRSEFEAGKRDLKI